MKPMCEVRVPFELDKPRTLIFNYNTIAEYEEASGKFYWDTMMNLFDTQTRVSAKAVKEGRTTYGWVELLRELPMRDLRILLWASLHEYDKNGELFHPLSISQLSRYVDPNKTLEVLQALLKGHQANSPTKEELGEASAPQPEVPENGQPESAPGGNGGAVSIESLASALG